MKRSLRARYTLILVALLAIVIAVTVFVNQTYLSHFYMLHKQKEMNRVYEELDEIIQTEGAFSEEQKDEWIVLADTYNISLIVMRDNETFFLGREPEERRMIEKLHTYIFGDIEGELIETTERYRIYKSYDPIVGAYYLETSGILSNNYILLIRTPIQSIQESALISNQFYMYVGLAAVAVGAVIMYIATRRLTDPILNLSSIAEKMSHLDFTARYTGKEENEIAVLGESMNQMSDKLERTISELKTANLELQQDLEQRTRVDEMRNDFISGVSHELKTPIALIQGYAEGLKEGISQDPESMAFYCDVIIDEAERMNRMVKKMLTLNQIEFGAEVPTVDHFELSQLVKELLQPYRRVIEQKQIHLRLHLPETYVWADEFMIEEVLGNYLSNAFHYVKGENRIEIRIGSDQETARIAVFNSGDPIPEESIDQIWEKFYKVDKARSREYDGNGIGLSIVRAIMEKHGKPCGVRNVEGGVEFWIELDAKSN